MRLIVITLLLFTITTANAQKRTEPGYYITLDGTRVNCEVELKNWIIWDNEILPVWINGQKEEVDIAGIKEFGAGEHVKFITAEVNIEKSSNELDKMTNSSKPQFQQERVLLKTIIEGNYSLYEYLNSGVKKFFFKTRNSEIEQLIFITFFSNDEKSRVSENRQYIDQLKEINTCQNTKFLTTEYEVNSLERYFLNLNECANTPISFSRKQSLKAGFEFDVFAGVNTATFESRRLFNSNDFEGNVTSLTVGVNAKYRIPLGANSVTVGLDVSYNNFESDEDVEFENFSGTRQVEITYSDLLIGLEGQFNIVTGEKQQVHFGAGYYVPVLLDDYTYYESLSELMFTGDSVSDNVAALIIGYTYGRFDVNIHYFLGEINLFNGINSFNVDLNRKFSVRAQYRLF